MKKVLFSLLSVAIAIAAIVTLFMSMAQSERTKVVATGNHSHSAITFKADEYQCSECKMPIRANNHAAEAVTADGKTYFFDDIGCMVLWLNDKSFKTAATLWVHAVDTAQWIDARKAWYALGDDTPMLYGFGAYAKESDARIGYEAMALKMLRGETMADPYIRKKIKGE